LQLLMSVEIVGERQPFKATQVVLPERPFAMNGAY
jgi:hypothetical protein